MSHDATNWAIKQRGIKPAAKIVLWHLCDRYHPDHGCFPSKETLAADCEMSERSVYDQLKVLEEAGLIKIETGEYQAASGKFKSNHYILCFDKSPSANSAVGKNTSSPSANSRKNRRQNLPDNSVKEPVREPVSADASTHTDFQFEDFWGAHPKARDRDATREAYITAVKSGVTPSAIISAAKKYAAENFGNGKQFLKGSASWLTDRRWTDYTETPAHPSKANSWATIIKRGKPIRQSAISDSLLREIVHLGLATPDQIKSTGLEMPQ